MVLMEHRWLMLHIWCTSRDSPYDKSQYYRLQGLCEQSVLQTTQKRGHQWKVLPEPPDKELAAVLPERIHESCKSPARQLMTPGTHELHSVNRLANKGENSNRGASNMTIVVPQTYIERMRVVVPLLYGT